MQWRSLQVRMSIRSWSGRATTTAGIVSISFESLQLRIAVHVQTLLFPLYLSPQGLLIFAQSHTMLQ
jgi:hypothetical protein